MVKIVILLKDYPKVYKKFFVMKKLYSKFLVHNRITNSLSLNHMAIAITSFLTSHSFTIRTDFFIPYRSSIHDITLMGV